MMDLKNSWTKLASKYCKDVELIEDYWNEIKSHYTSEKRCYHNLNHIENLLQQAEMYQKQLHDYDLLCFSIWYHDSIYNPTKSNNEEKSADLAQVRLEKFTLNAFQIETIKTLILSTKKHEVLSINNIDNAYFLDFDLSILGADWQTYQAYSRAIRKEYSIYPDVVYKKSRKKVLLNFLLRDNLYFSETYQNLFETQARKNLNREIEKL